MNFRSLFPLVLAFLVGCGEGDVPDTPRLPDTPPDTTAPFIQDFSANNGASVTLDADGSYRLAAANIGQSKSYSLKVSEKLAIDSIQIVAFDAVGQPSSLPSGMSATLKATDVGQSTYLLTLSTSKDFAFEQSVSTKVVRLAAALVDSANNKTSVAIKVPVADLMPIANRTLEDWLFTDNAATAPMVKLKADGSYLTYPLPASEITNPAYSADASCTQGNGNCYNSHWAIDTSVTDPVGRAISYTFDVTTTDSTLAGDAEYMRSTFVMTSGGLLSQRCWTRGYSSTPKPADIPYCFDSGGIDNFTVTVIAMPANGATLLRRNFQFKVRDDG